MYLFIALYPMIRVSEFCRPIIVVDGTHLSGPYQGTFLSASTLDGASMGISFFKFFRLFIF